jgi:outer membrane protein
MGPSRFRYATLPIGLGLILPLTLSTVSRPAAAADSAESSDSSHAVDDQWRFQLGAGAINMPRYPGSRADVNRGIPIVSISYGRYFIGGGPGSGGPAGFGAFLLRDDHWAVAVSAGGDTRKTRRASDAPVLNGWGDISGTAHGTLSASYSESWFSIHGSVSAAGHHEGVQATLGADLKYRPTQQLTLSIGPQVTFTNSQYAMTYFGVNSAQSEIAGIAPYRARGGVNSIGAAALANYQLTKHWSVAAFVNYGVLQGDAANSPVTTDKTQRVIGAFAAYGF